MPDCRADYFADTLRRIAKECESAQDLTGTPLDAPYETVGTIWGLAEAALIIAGYAEEGKRDELAE